MIRIITAATTLAIRACGRLVYGGRYQCNLAAGHPGPCLGQPRTRIR